MRSGASSRPSACWISSSAWLRAVRSVPRLVLCIISAWPALRATVSCSVRLSPRCGTRMRTRLPRRSDSSSSNISCVGRQRRHQDLAGYGVVVGVVGTGVQLEEELLDQLGGVALVDAVGHPAPLAADAPAADVEDLDGDLERVLREGDHVGVGAVAEDDGLLLQRLLDRAEVVAQPRCALEVELLGRGVHLAHGCA